MFFLLCLGAWLVVVLLIARSMKANGEDVDTKRAIDSIRGELDNFDELRTYTERPHAKAITEPRK
jgi:hypothetical protein